MSVLITNIGELTTQDPLRESSRLRDAAVVLEGDRIAWIGSADRPPAADERVDAGGRAVLPGWVDSHTHLIFAGDRTAEFEARMAGEAYAAGGINVTVNATREASDQGLRDNLLRLVGEARRGGTTTIETKTGYGLTVEDELRAARIAGEIVDEVTFLGAHVVPEGSAREEYLRLVTGEMLDTVAPHVSAVDVFCETGAFDAGETARVLQSARERSLATHVHGNQLGPGPGVQLAVEYRSLSVDHLGFLSAADIDALAAAATLEHPTVATVLPACDLSTRMPLAPARELVDAGAIVAIASNCNPGTSYTSSMGFAVATAVLQMRLTVEEAVYAATYGGARALGRHVASADKPAVGHISVGARADIQMLDAPSVTHLAYRPGMPLTAAVWAAGRRVV
ncbi:imidazolonepropionase [Lysinibacter sp. HNR]|uniref:imidazolonepropionase n=1 Tax=Lysinibacter sp. HNR TaxID=3031408 RepID=UPI00243589FB|nr:imidazolonepropionase [Lysinibacter sp. HNR]WGD37740.1 imidazolonepropionase [Lysinibacter sp. HNR]